MRLQNLKFAYQSFQSYLITIFFALLLAAIMFAFTEYEVSKGNLGAAHANANVILQVLLALFFGINMNLLWCKLKMATAAKEGATTSIGAILSILVSGCPACSITIASYLGLSALLTSLPFFGLELKVVGLLILLYSTDSLLRNLTVCKS